MIEDKRIIEDRKRFHSRNIIKLYQQLCSRKGIKYCRCAETTLLRQRHPLTEIRAKNFLKYKTTMDWIEIHKVLPTYYTPVLVRTSDESDPNRPSEYYVVYRTNDGNPYDDFTIYGTDDVLRKNITHWKIPS